MVLSFTMLRLATNTQDTLVIDDYYKEGKGINLELTKVQEAKAMGLVAAITVSDNNLVLAFDSNTPDASETLQLRFQHATLASKDFSILLSRDAKGNYRAPVDTDIQGKWRITLAPLSDKWKLSTVATFPRESAIVIQP